MNIVEATCDDADALAALHRQCFGEAWDAKAFGDLLAAAEVFARVAHAAEPWQALVLARAAAGEAEILTLATLPAVWRQGHARALVIAAADEAVRRGAGEMFLEVAADNAPAIVLYRGLGFAPVGRRPSYYARGPSTADALTLRASLPFSGGVAPRAHGAAPPG